MMTKKVKIGFIGVGTMGQCAHLKNYACLKDDCEVVAIAELRQNTAKTVSARYGIPKVYQKAEEMLKNEKLDGIVASQPFTRHGILLKSILNAKVPVFIEKPLAGSIPVAEEILKIIQKTKTPVMVGYHKRSDPACEYAKQVINDLKNSNEIGAMKYIRILMPSGDWIAGGFSDLISCEEGPMPELQQDPPDHSMNSKTYAEYITFVNYYIHQINLMRFLLGEDYQVTYADPGKVLIAGVSDSGVTCAIEMTPYSTTIDWQESALVAFEKGYIKIELPAPVASNRPGSVEIFKDPGNGKTPVTLIPQFDWVHAMKNQAKNFISLIRKEQEATCSAQEAIKDLKLAKDYIDLLKGEIKCQK